MFNGEPAENQPLGSSDGEEAADGIGTTQPQQAADGNWPTQPQAADGNWPTQPTAADANGATQPTAANDGNWSTQPNPQTTTQQPVQDTSQLMFMMGQLMAAQHTQQEAMMKLMADREASSSSRSSNGLSSLAKSVNTSGLLKCDEYHGEKESSWAGRRFSTAASSF